jgi:hypothetical protein
MIYEFDNFQEENLFPTLIDSESFEGPNCKECGDQDSFCPFCQYEDESDCGDESSDEEFAGVSFERDSDLYGEY